MTEKLTQTHWYDYVPIIDRPPLELPGGARVAVVPYINIEHFPCDVAGIGIAPQTNAFTPDTLNYGWRDYGNRVGLWRIMKLLDDLGARATVCLNSDIIREAPRIIEEGMKRNWAWIGHGINNAWENYLAGAEPAREREIISTALAAMQRAIGRKTKGWLSPGLTHTFNTPDILVELGLEYLCDYTADDHPFRFNTSGGTLIAVPYSIDLNDVPTVLVEGISGEEFGNMIVDQFDVLYDEGRTNGRIMPVCLHTFLVGQPFRFKHLRRAFEYIARHDHVWWATSDEVNDWYRKANGL